VLHAHDRSHHLTEGRDAVTYLLKYATRRPATGARVDERLRLNRPGLYGGAYVRVFVGDTSGARFRRVAPHPRIALRIADCANVIALEFDLSNTMLRENSLYKIDTLVGALTRFREALAAEAALCAEREH
jgi:hypothetical protein